MKDGVKLNKLRHSLTSSFEFDRCKERLLSDEILNEIEVEYILKDRRNNEERANCLLDVLLCHLDRSSGVAILTRKHGKFLDYLSQEYDWIFQEYNKCVEATATDEEKIDYRLALRRTRRLDDQIMNLVSEHASVPSRWTDLANLLRLGTDILNVRNMVMMNMLNFNRHTYCLLQVWQTKAPSLATVGNLVVALRALGLNGVADDLQNKYMDTNKNDDTLGD